MGTTAPQPWEPWPLVHGDCSPLSMGTRALAHPRAASPPHQGHMGPGSARTPGCCPAGTPTLRGNPGDKGGHCHLEASLGIVSPKPGPPQVLQQLGPCQVGVPPCFGGSVCPRSLQSCSQPGGFNSFARVQVGEGWVLCKHVSVAMNGARWGQTGAPRDTGDRSRERDGFREQRCKGQPGDARPQGEGTGNPRCAGLSRQSRHVQRGTVPPQAPAEGGPSWDQPCVGRPRDTR